VKIFTSVEKEWEDVLPHFLYGTRNIQNSVTGFSPAELVFGEKIRTTFSLDGNFNRWMDQVTELARAMYRLNLAEQVIADRKLDLFQRSADAVAERFAAEDFKKGQEVFTFIDTKPGGVVRREFIHWDGPFKILDAGKEGTNVVIEKYGVRTTVNKTKCIRVGKLDIPNRDAKGKEIPGTPEFEAAKDLLVKKKVAYLKKRIDDGEVAEREAYDNPKKEGKSSPEEEVKKALKKISKAAADAPSRKLIYEAHHLKVGMMVLVYLSEKKGMYLAQVTHIWIPEDKKWESEKWIRCHLWGKGEKDPAKFGPWWLDGRRQCFKVKKKHHHEWWQDVYAKDIRYVLDHPLEKGAIDKRDLARVEKLWGKSMEILLVFAGSP
jgi:hypothetical protein